jgi:hypothetical protein
MDGKKLRGFVVVVVVAATGKVANIALSGD